MFSLVEPFGPQNGGHRDKRRAEHNDDGKASRVAEARGRRLHRCRNKLRVQQRNKDRNGRERQLKHTETGPVLQANAKYVE